MHFNSPKTHIVFSVDLDKLNLLEKHNADIARSLLTMAQIASDNRHAGKQETTEIAPPGFTETYNSVVRKAFRPDDTGIDPEVADVLRAVHVYDYTAGKIGAMKTTAEMPPRTALFILQNNADLSLLMNKKTLGHDLKAGLENAPDGIVNGFNGTGQDADAQKTISKAFTVFCDKDHTHDDESEGIYGILQSSVVMNRSDETRYVLIEGGGISTFGSNPYAGRDGVEPQLD